METTEGDDSGAEATEFDDYEEGDGPGDLAAVDAYGRELEDAVEAFGVPVLEPGVDR